MLNINSLIKVLKLHTMLGKPIPSTDPVVVNTASGSSSTSASSKSSTGASGGPKTITKTIATATSIAKKVVTPKITFVGMWMYILLLFHT